MHVHCSRGILRAGVALCACVRMQVQLRHNKRKSDALKKLLSPDQMAGGSVGAGGGDGASLQTSDLDPAHIAAQAAAYRELLDDDGSIDTAGLQDILQRADA